MWIAAIAVLAWGGNGLYVQDLMSGRRGVTVNPLTHQVTLEMGEDFPADQVGRAGFIAGIGMGSHMCETTAAEIPGFGWAIVIRTKDGLPVLSCWSWR